MRSPIHAMLWENWRLTRVEAALRLGLGLVAGAAAMVLVDDGATIAFSILMVLHGACVWFSILKLNGGNFADGYKPGFPFYLLYSRPVPTVAFVGVAMAYDAVSCAALYLLSAALLGFTFGQPLPLFSVTAWIVAAHFCYHCVQWSTPSRVVQWVGSVAFGLPLLLLLKNRVASPLQVEFSLVENALLVLMGVAAFALTVAGVARQRRGGAVATVPRTAVSGGYPDWFVALFRFPCPTSSATRAQVWFELKTSGLPVLAIGLGLAILIFLLFAISIPVTHARPAALGVAIFVAPAVLLVVGGNAFGIRRRQGRTYTSTFAATQPYGTAQMAGLKVLVRTACVLAAFIAIGLSVWTSSSLVSAWGSWVIGGNVRDGVPGLMIMRRTIGDGIGALPGYAHIALAVVTSIAVALTIASAAAIAALRARYSRRVILAASLLLFGGLALVLLALAGNVGVASEVLVGAIFGVAKWIAAVAMVFTTVYLFWNSFEERVLTVRYACSVLVISVIFAAAWVTLLHGGGVRLAGMPAMNVVSILGPPLLFSLMASALAPWSLNRIRHT